MRIIKTTAFVIVLCCTAADVMLCCYLYSDLNDGIHKQTFAIIYITLTQFMFMTNLVTFFFLLSGLVRIRKQLFGLDDVLMDTKIVGMHIAAFLIYVISLFLYDGFYVNNILNNSDRSELEESLCNIINSVLSLVSQTILIVIFNLYSGYDKQVMVSADFQGNIVIRTSQVS
jgi:hypothetical protein